MSSPAAAAAGGDAAQQGQQGGQEGQQQAAQGFDPAQLNETLQGFQSGQEQLRAVLGQLAEQAQQPPEWAQPLLGQQDDGQQQPPIDLSFLDNPELDAGQQAEQMAATVEQLVQQRLEAALGEHIAPITARLDEREQAEAAQQFVDEFPEVGDPDTGKQVMELSRNYASQLGLPAEIANKLGGNFRFARIIYAATKAFEAAAEEGREGSDDPGAAVLEGGGGAAPSSAGQGDASQKWLKDVAGMKRGSSVLPWG